MKKHSKSEIWLIVLAASYNLIITGIGMAWIFTGIFDCLKTKLFASNIVDSNDLTSFSYLFFAGAIGGAAYCLRAIYMRLADAYPENEKNRETNSDPAQIFNIKVWFFWYIYRPIQSGILAIVLICLFSQGIVGIDKADPQNLHSIFFQFGIGFLIGFGTHEVINKIKDLIQNLFSSSKSTDKTNSVSNDATLSKIDVDGVSIPNFSPSNFTYNLEHDVLKMPEIKGTANNPQAKVDIKPVITIPGEAVIIVTAQDGKTSKIYTVKFSQKTTTPINPA